VFALHVTQISMFMVMPAALVKYAGLPVAEHWKIYLPVVLVSFGLMLPPVFIGEKRGKMRAGIVGRSRADVAGPAWLVGRVFASGNQRHRADDFITGIFCRLQYSRSKSAVVGLAPGAGSG